MFRLNWTKLVVEKWLGVRILLLSTGYGFFAVLFLMLASPATPSIAQYGGFVAVQAFSLQY